MRTRLTIVLAATLAGCATAPTNTAAVPVRTAAPPSDQDKAWMWAVHEGNLAEVQAGRLAQGKGTTKEIKAIGGMLVEDHTKLDIQVTDAASKLGIRLPTSPSAEQRAELVRLRKATGKDFDEDFLAGMTKEHKAAIAATHKEISEGSSPAVVGLAKAAEPELQKHLDALRRSHGE
jgi:putative membrane protein